MVTMRWWDDLWLNESLATWASLIAQAEATRWPNAWTTFSQARKARAYRQDQLPSAHPIGADIVDIHVVEVNFDGITYAKGAAVLKQLVAYAGRDRPLRPQAGRPGQAAPGRNRRDRRAHRRPRAERRAKARPGAGDPTW